MSQEAVIIDSQYHSDLEKAAPGVHPVLSGEIVKSRTAAFPRWQEGSSPLEKQI